MMLIDHIRAACQWISCALTHADAHLAHAELQYKRYEVRDLISAEWPEDQIDYVRIWRDGICSIGNFDRIYREER